MTEESGKKKRSLKKGYYVEKKFCEYLTSLGFIYDRAERSMRVIPVFEKGICPTCHRYQTFTITKKHDTFGLFDVMAKHSYFPDFTFYFQITANYWKSGKDRIAIEGFPAGKNDIVCMVRKMDRKDYTVREYINKEWIEKTKDDFFNKYFERDSRGIFFVKSQPVEPILNDLIPVD